MYAGNTPSSSFTNVRIRLPLGSNDIRSLENFPPDESITNASTVAVQTATTTWEEVVETHYHITPDSDSNDFALQMHFHHHYIQFQHSSAMK